MQLAFLVTGGREIFGSFLASTEVLYPASVAWTDIANGGGGLPPMSDARVATVNNTVFILGTYVHNFQDKIIKR